MKKSLAVLCLAAAVALACSSAAKTPPAAAAASPQPTRTPAAMAAAPASEAAAQTPTPSARQRINPDVLEDTTTYTIQRFKKSEYIRVDDKHIRSPIVPHDVEFFKEDEEYYYVYTPKPGVEEARAQQEALAEALPATPDAAPGAPAPKADAHGMPPEDFEDLTPPRAAAKFRLEEVTNSGLPAIGMWRHSFVVADVNGDGKPDIVAPPARLGGDPSLHIYLGDGRGAFTRQKLSFSERGKAVASVPVAYGGVAVGDIDRDGKQDVVIASHAGGLQAFFGEGDGRYAVENQGLPARNFSSQAVVLTDVNSDQRLDIVASIDVYEGQTAKWAPDQVRVFLNDGKRGWIHKPDALVDAAHSNSLSTFDYNSDGRMDVVTGSQIYGAVQLLWKNDGNGKFSTGIFDQIEIHGFHFAMAPGTFGKSRVPAFADAFNRTARSPVRLQAEGITVYSYEKGAWTRHRIWRKKEGKSSLFALAMGDLDGDGLDDVVFSDSEVGRIRVFFQQGGGTWLEAEEGQEPKLGSAGQCIRLADLDGDGRLDLVVAKTYPNAEPGDRGGWRVYLNKK